MSGQGSGPLKPDEQAVAQMLAAIGKAKAAGGSDLERLPKRMSPSSAKTYQQCPQLYWFKFIAGLSSPSTVEAARGTLAHAAFERIFDHPAAERTPELAISYIRPAWQEMTNPTFTKKQGPGTKSREKAQQRADDYRALAPEGSDIEQGMFEYAEKMVHNWFAMEHVDRIEPTEIKLPNGEVIDGRELSVGMALFGVYLNGFIDRFDRWETVDGQARYSVSDYKGLALDTPLPTPTGWTTMGDVQVGDLVMGADGHPTQVIVKSDVHTDRPCYRVEFSDKTSIVCDNVHLWEVEYGEANKRAPRTVDADELHRLVHSQDGNKRRLPVVIRNAAPLQLPEAKLPIDPYVLGVWLGDGDSDSGGIHASAAKVAHLVEELQRAGENVRLTGPDKGGMYTVTPHTRAESLCIRGHLRTRGRTSQGWYPVCPKCEADLSVFPSHAPLRSRLRWLGLLSNKHVPAEYLRASRDQRLALLQGLMDTDGSWNSTKNQAVFTTTSPALADAVRELINSLGCKQTTYEWTYDSRKGPRTASQTMFTPVDFNPFRLPDKASKVRTAVPSKARSRWVVAVVPVESVPTQCIAVEAADSLYLAGRQMVVTHNTGKAFNQTARWNEYRQSMRDKIRWESFFQLRVYALLAWEIYKVPVNVLRLIYVATGDRQEGIATMTVTKDVIDRTRQEVRSTWNAMQRSARENSWPTKTGPLCAWCYFQDACPAFGNDLPVTTDNGDVLELPVAQ